MRPLHDSGAEASPPRILLLLPELSGSKGGIQAYGRLLLKSLSERAARRECAIEALSLGDSPQELAGDDYSPGAHLVGFAGSRRRFVGAAFRRAALGRPDLIIVGHVNFSPLVPLLCAASRHSRLWLLAYGAEVWRRLGFLKRTALRRSDRVVSISDFTRDRLVALNDVEPARTALLPCALDPGFVRRFEPLAATAQPDLSRPLLLTVGRLELSEGAKGVGDVLRALPAIATRVPDVRYLVIGDGDARPALQLLAAELGVQGRVDFAGRLPVDALARAYAESALFVMPSQLEGFGIVYIEAAFFGTPTVATTVGGTPEVVRDGETGLLVPPGDVGALATAVTDLLLKPDVRNSMERRARLAAREDFSYDTFDRQLGALLQY